MGPRGSSNVGTGGGPDLDNIMSFFDRVSNIEVLGGGRGNGPSHIPDVTLVQNTGAGAGSGNIEPFGISRSSGRMFRGPNIPDLLQDALRIQAGLQPQLRNEANPDDTNRMQEEPIRNPDAANPNHGPMIIEPPRGISIQATNPTANTNATNNQDDVDSLIQMTTGNLPRPPSMPAHANPQPTVNTQPHSPPAELQTMSLLNPRYPFPPTSSSLSQFPLTSHAPPQGDPAPLLHPFSSSQIERLQPTYHSSRPLPDSPSRPFPSNIDPTSNPFVLSPQRQWYGDRQG